MESLYLLIPLSVLLVFLIGLLFWWSVRSGQFDDLEGPGYRVLMDNDKPEVKREETLGQNTGNESGDSFE
ncbi:MAG: cbb3-type cytochrome oxidase assembly protein CcoS [Propionivibrio sp.]|jgi:cbb3-type cytochrome oxidase maturation protein|nr:cbb3-type cytochrome oxidase assembly protein CcoS [Propionivibrio sp.]